MSQTNHPYAGCRVAFATMHGKEKILAKPFLKNLSINLIVPENIDTDKYGTFSGEIKRTDVVKEVLRQKATEGADKLGLNLGLASEGSFLMHPRVPFLGSNQESLLFIDLKKKTEVFVRLTSLDNSAEFIDAESEEDVRSFCQRVQCGPQGLIVKPTYEFDDPTHIVKGLTETEKVIKTFNQMKNEFGLDRVWIETDNRAHMSPKRRQVIRQVGEKLIGTLQSLCPSCQTPGFAMSDFVKGLMCRDCGLKSDWAAQEIWSCPRQSCDYQEPRGRLDGLQRLDPAHCQWCNP